MDRATFEKIVVKGSYAIVGLDGEWAKVYDVKTGKKIYFYLPTATPFQVRCGCFAIGIACDWDQPVSFEMLMELEGAESLSQTTVRIRKGVNRLVFYNYKSDGDKADIWVVGNYPTLTTMRQVHLLLEAAGVGT